MTAVDFSNMGRGLIPRDMRKYPIGYCCKAFGDAFQPMSDSEIDDRIELLEREKATLIDIRNISGPNGGPIPSTDQNGSNYCWFHSTVSSMLLLRAKQGLEYVPLNAYSGATVIKGGRNEGGWCQESVEFAIEHGVCTTKTWPFQQMRLSNWNDAAKAEAKLYRITEWYDGGDDPRLFWTAVALGFPVVSDFNHMGHSMVTIHANRRQQKGWHWNSWSDNYENNGVGVFSGWKCVPNNWMVPRIVTS